jgi:tRNA-modifying protein YgfZ
MGTCKPTVASEILWCKITSYGVLRFDGPDALSFLQGQLTNNVAALDEVHSQYTGYCTPKGRLLAVMLLWRRADAYYLMLPRELCEAVRKRLSMYILRAKVKASDVSAEQILFGVSGADAASVVATLTGTVPGTVHDVVHGNGVSVLKLPAQRFLIVAALPDAGAIEAVLTRAAAATADTLWSALDIEAGIPNVVATTQEQFIPQAVNFDLFGAVSFNKGCYPGQEIVARMHYLGNAKQRMVRARLNANGVPAAGDKLYSAAYGNQASGMIVSTVSTQAGSHEVLAVVQNSSIEKADIHWQAPDGPALDIMPLPYSVK